CARLGASGYFFIARFDVW
nr:immunoglobulin heavy chain junction region [Macaca mulatta]